MMHRIYRKMMRKAARFILGFDRCPASCRKNYREIFGEAVDAFLLCAIAIALFGVLVIFC